MDVPDISRNLKSVNNNLQIQTMIILCEKIQKENNSIIFKKLLNLIFEACQSNFSNVSEFSCSWIYFTIINILKEKNDFSIQNKNYFKNFDLIFTEILSRIKKSKHQKFLIQLILGIVNLQDITISENSNISTSFHQ